jgi:hypothetical protein
MRKAINALLLALMMTAGIMVVSGCSNDDDEQTGRTDEQTEETAVMPSNKLTQAASQVNGSLADLNFQELQALKEVVPYKMTNAPSSSRASDDDVRTEFENKLSTLLTVLEGEGPVTRSITMGRRFSFQAFNDALSLAWDLSVTLGDMGESSSSWFGLNTTKRGEANYTARDGSLYTVKGEIVEEVEIKWRGFKTHTVVSKACEFSIAKNGEQVVRIESDSESERPLWLPIIIKDYFYSGQLYYHDYEINLTYDKNSTHRRTVDLTYGRTSSEVPLLTMTAKLEDDADVWKLLTHDVNVHADFTVRAIDGLLAFNGTTDNVNYLVVNGVKMAKCMEEGTTEQECREIVESFNSNLTLSILMSDLPVGELYMDSMYDATTNRWYPTLMIHSDILGSKDYPVATILQMLGIDIPEILRTANI